MPICLPTAAAAGQEAEAIGVATFLEHHGWQTFRSELLWVWLPVTTISAAAFRVRCRVRGISDNRISGIDNSRGINTWLSRIIIRILDLVPGCGLAIRAQVEGRAVRMHNRPGIGTVPDSIRECRQGETTCSVTLSASQERLAAS
jgi:hypothetical protein